jgi:hypothetical protein
MANRETGQPGKISPPARAPREGRELESIGPSDSSDSGSDLIGPGIAGGDEMVGLDRVMNEDDDGTSDRSGTGEGLAADGDAAVQVAADIAPDRVVGADEAGLGGGLDQAEEAQLGVTDEELARRRRN